MKILLVEDNELARFTLAMQLDSLGHAVTACADAESALEAYGQTDYPLIVLDLGLPRVNGIELCRRIRARPQGDLRMILVITAWDQPKELQAALDAGVDDYLLKPASMDQLQTRLTILERQFRHLTIRKQSEEELRQAYRELTVIRQELIQSESLAAMGGFVSGVAHEIRNALTSIKVSVQYCLKSNALAKEMKEFLEIILRNTEKANRTLEELLDFAKPKRLSFSPGDIVQVIRKACDFTKARCVQQKIRIHKRCARRLPRILMDAHRIEQVFVNCILNALDAMKHGGRLSITAFPAGADVVVTFTDTGSGISEDNLKKLFTPFFTTKLHGYGLGLALAHRLIELHHGAIAITSRVHEGTQVSIRLPIVSEQPCEELEHGDDLDR